MIVNILSFHNFVSTTNLPLALVVTAFWLIVFFQVRSAFSGVFVQRISDDVRGSSGGQSREHCGSASTLTQQPL